MSQLKEKYVPYESDVKQIPNANGIENEISYC